MGVVTVRVVRIMITSGEYSSSVGRLGRRGFQAGRRVFVDHRWRDTATRYAYRI